MGRPRKAYAQICANCQHPNGGHLGAAQGFDLRLGPYVCEVSDCDCSVPQVSPTFGVTKRQFDEAFPGWAKQPL